MAWRFMPITILPELNLWIAALGRCGGRANEYGTAL